MNLLFCSMEKKKSIFVYTIAVVITRTLNNYDFLCNNFLKKKSDESWSTFPMIFCLTKIMFGCPECKLILKRTANAFVPYIYLTKLNLPIYLNSKLKFREFPSYLLPSYFLFILYLPRCTLPDFPSVSSLAFLPFNLVVIEQQQQQQPYLAGCTQAALKEILYRKILFLFYR